MGLGAWNLGFRGNHKITVLHYSLSAAVSSTEIRGSGAFARIASAGLPDRMVPDILKP
jgi:hypothetical protein